MYDTWCLSVPPYILDIPHIPDIPELQLFLMLLSRSATMQNLEVLSSKMAELWPFQIFQKKSPDVENSYRPKDRATYTIRWSRIKIAHVENNNLEFGLCYHTCSALKK